MRSWRRRLAYVFRQSRIEAELREEIEAHRVLRAAQLERDGQTPQEQSALLFERAPGGRYRAGDRTIPADGLLARRLRHFPHTLPIAPGDFRAWRRWADEHRPEQVAEIETLERSGVRIAVPLRARDDLIAMLLLGAPEGRERFTDEETAVLSSAADVFALLLENGRLNARALEQEKVRRDLALAAEVQRRLLPPPAPHRDTVSCAAFTLPARTVGGDYYDFLDLEHDRMGIAMADIAGKGIPAALLMSAVQAWVRVIAADTGRRVSELAAHMNRLLHRFMATNAYATFFYAQLDLRTLQLCYVNAGHHPPLVIRKAETGIVTLPLCAGGTVLGLFPDVNYEEGTFALQPGDRLVAFTDGVIEARSASGEELGDERLKELLRTAVDAPAEETSSRLAHTIRTWTAGAEQQDDVTFLVVAVPQRRSGLGRHESASFDGSAT